VKSCPSTIIQTFLSEEISEEIQIQGRTARQGKQGTYQLLLLEPDIVSEFGICPGEQDNVPKRNQYEWLCNIRNKHHSRQCKIIDANLLRASEVDNATHEYFDSLLEANTNKALAKFQTLYQTIKKPPYPSVLNLDLAFVIDVTGSMMPFTKCVASTIQGLVDGQNSIVEKLKARFPEIQFAMRAGCLGYRDIAMIRTTSFKTVVLLMAATSRMTSPILLLLLQVFCKTHLEDSTSLKIILVPLVGVQVGTIPMIGLRKSNACLC
jgi:hypothetical protein